MLIFVVLFLYIEYLNHLEYIKCKTIKILHTNNKAIQIGKNSCNLMT